MPASPVALGLQSFAGESKLRATQEQFGHRFTGPMALSVVPAGSCSSVLDASDSGYDMHVRPMGRVTGSPALAQATRAACSASVVSLRPSQRAATSALAQLLVALLDVVVASSSASSVAIVTARSEAWASSAAMVCAALRCALRSIRAPAPATPRAAVRYQIH